MRAVLLDPVGVKEDQPRVKLAMFASSSPVLFRGIIRDLKAISSTADEDIQMNIKAGFVAKTSEPGRERPFAFAFGTDKEAFSLRDREAGRHSSAEGWQSA